MSPMKAIAAALLSTLLFACGSSDPESLIKAGHEAQGKAQSKEALAKFEEALKTLKPGDALYVEAKLGAIEACIADDPKKATDEFLALAAALPDQIDEKKFVYIGGQMVSAQKYSEALDLVHAGIKRSGGESPALMLQIDRIRKESVNDKAVSDKLKGLGYTN
jgi:hypothetical protein